MRRSNIKKIFSVGLICLGLFLVGNFVSAQIDPGLNYVGPNIGMGTQDIRITIANIIRIMLGILGIVAVVIILYGGFLYMTAGGEIEKIKKSKQLLVGAVIGLIIVLSAFTIASFIISSIQSASGPGGGGEVQPPTPPTPPLPPPPLPGFCQDPDLTSDAPYICSLSPKQAKKGDYITILGGKFLAFDSTKSQVVFVKEGETIEHPATIVLCGSNPAWQNIEIVVEVPNDLTFNSSGPNTYNVYVKNDKGSSQDKPVGALNPTHKFTLQDGQPGPGIACLVPDFGNKNQAIKVLGKRFGSAQGTNKFIFNENAEAETITGWSDTELTSVNVPSAAISGNTFIKVNNQDSNQVYFRYICDIATDCASGCCYDSSLGKMCAPVSYCLPGPGESCDDNAESADTCEVGDCRSDLICDTATCQCRYPQAGDPCDGDTATAACQADNTKCSADNICNPTTCLCEEAMVITAVTPNDGAPGNYITISGKGFGQGGGVGNNILINSGFEDPNVKPWVSNLNLPFNPDVMKITDQTAFSGSRSLAIDTSFIHPTALFTGDPQYSWYYGFYYPTQYIRPKLENDSQYLVSLKIKGLVDVNTEIKFFAVFGDGSTRGKDWLRANGYPNFDGNCDGPTLPAPFGSCPNEPANYASCCRWARGTIPQTSTLQRKDLFTIPKGNYTDWQNFQTVFTYDKDMQSWVKDNNYNILLGFWFGLQTTPSQGMKAFIDDFEIKKLSNPGKVTFCGTACGDNDDVTAKFPYEVNSYCSIEDAWQNNQIIAIVPMAYSAQMELGGSIIKVTGISGAQDQTNLAPGLPLDNFKFTTIKKPSLCSVVPKSASFDTSFRAYGSGFGMTKGNVLIGNPSDNKSFDNFGGWSWLDTVIANIKVPNVQPGTYNTSVKVGTLLSNPVNFTVIPIANAPRIDAIDPVQGQPGQYITILGSNLGNTAGFVKFNNQETDKNNWANADISFPAQCQTNYWHDSYIVVKVPNLPAGQIDVLVKAGDIFSNTVKFNICAPGAGTCPLTPGICAITPNQGPVGLSGVTLYGDNFNSYGDNSKVTFYNNIQAENLSVNWTNNQIGIGNQTAISDSPIVIPSGATSGPVKITDKNSNISNTVKFEVSDCRLDNKICKNNTMCCSTGVCQTQCVSPAVLSCSYNWSFTTGTRLPYFGPPYVVEDSACVNNTQSPSPWLTSENNCADALVSARFRQPAQNGEVDANILTSTLTISNILVLPCGNADVFDDKNCAAEGIAGRDTNPIEFENPHSLTTGGPLVTSKFVFYPKNLLQPNTWYKVILKSDPINKLGITNENRIYLDGNKDNLDGGEYSWHFRIRNSADVCPVDKVLVSPSTATLTLLTEQQEYSSYPVASNCNILNPSNFTWNWWKIYSDGHEEDAADTDTGYGVATINPKPNFGSYKQIALPQKQGLVNVGVNIFPDDPARYKEDRDNTLIIDLNIPQITDFYPKDGINQSEVNSYVTIEGLNFGNSQGSSQVLFGEAEAQLADCSDSWTDSKIKVIVPKSNQIEAEGTKTIDTPTPLSTVDMLMGYNFDESGDVIVNDLNGSHQGEINNAVKVDSPFGKALQFNGTNSYVRIGGDIRLAAGSIEMWFKPENSGILFSATSTTGNDFIISYDDTATLGVIKKNQWNHLVYVYNNNFYNLYLNGSRVNRPASRGIYIAGIFIGLDKSSYMLGAKEDNGIISDYFKGQIDNFSIYSKALSQQEAWSNFGLKSGQIVLLNFEEDGSEAVDSSANNFIGIAVNNQSIPFRSAEGKYGKAITFNNDNHINITNNPALVFDNQVTVEGWFKIDSLSGLSDNTIFESNNIYLGIDTGSNLRFQVTLDNFGGGPTEMLTTRYASIPLNLSGSLKNIELNSWNYFAGVYDGQKIKIYFNSLEQEYPATGKMIQTADFNQACLGGCNNNFKGSLDNLAVYNQALSSARINSRLGAKDNSFIKVITIFGQDISDFNDDGVKDTGETFVYSKNIYPFLCALQPNFGTENTAINVTGDNLGNSNKTIYQSKQYGIGSYLKFKGAPQEVLEEGNLKSWANQALSYINPFSSNLGIPVIKVYASIDPYSEPYNDKEPGELGKFDDGIDDFADIKPEPSGNGVYDKYNYSIYGQNSEQTELASNELDFYQPPVIVSLSPDNGPAKQWITIYGYNFGDEPGTVKFYNDKTARVIGCPNAVWRDGYIIAEVPEDAQTGGVKIITKQGLNSNEKPFKVNNNPLGAGLCGLFDPIIPDIEKINGNVSDPIKAVGVRFEDEQGSSNLVFYDRQNSIISDSANWKDTEIISTIPVGAQSGEVYVNKKVESGKKCVGFSIAGWCPSNKYDILYTDAPSNSLPMQIFNTCASGFYGTMEAREKGFPIETFTRAGNSDTGMKTEFSALNLGNLASDGTYLYAMYDNGYHNGQTFLGDSAEDNVMTIWKIGSGFNGTELGRVYKKYQASKIVNYPEDPTPGDQQLTSDISVSSLIYTPKGLFVGFVNHYGNRSLWLPSTHKDYNKEWWGVPKIRFNEANNTYDWDMVEIPQGLVLSHWAQFPEYVKSRPRINISSNRVFLKYTGSNILAIGTDGNKGFVLQVLNDDWKQVGWTPVNNAVPIPSNPTWGYNFTATYPLGFADEQYFYNFYGNRVQIIDWRKGEWVGITYGYNNWTGELNGTYDWKNQKYWMGTNRNDRPIDWVTWSDYYWRIVPHDRSNLLPHHNRLYRYEKCKVTGTGLCRSDLDCAQGGMCVRSKCENGTCTPEIKSFSPIEGPVGTWMTVSGCHFGCQPGQVYFSGPLTSNQIPTDGLVAGYTFDSTENNGLFSSSLTNPAISSQLIAGATISDGVLTPGAGYLDLDNRLANAASFGSVSSGKMTFLLKIKPTNFTYVNNSVTGLAMWLKGTIYFSILNNNSTQTSLAVYVRTNNGNVVIYSQGQIKANEWNNIAVVLEAGIGYKIYINGRLTDHIAMPTLQLFSWNGDTHLGNWYQKYQGQMDDFFLYNRALTAEEIAKFSFGNQGLELADPACWPNWNCSLTGGYDEVTVEVPNRKTPLNTSDDAISGSIKLVTAAGFIDSSIAVAQNLQANPPVSPNFTVTNNPLGPQICKLIPNYGNRGINVRIYGENFGSRSVTDDYVNFGPIEASIREPFSDVGDDKLVNIDEPEYNPETKPDPSGDDYNGSAGQEGSHAYDLGEPFIDINNNQQYDLNLIGANYYSQIRSFITQELWPSCPETGWDDKNICISVPANAAGFGTGAETALNNIWVNKGEQESGSKQFEVTFGSCGNQKIEPNKGEMCDGSLMPTISNAQKLAICTELFSPLYPNEQIAGCYAECNTGCTLSFCIGSDCKSMVDLCGNNKIEEFYNVDEETFYHEQCDTSTFPSGLTCSQAGYASDKVCASGDKEDEPCYNDDQCSDNKVCAGGDNQGEACTSNTDCPESTCQSNIACVQSCVFECGSCKLIVCDKDSENCVLSMELTCGNGKIDINEECDGSDVNNKTCNDFGGRQGALACYPPSEPIAYNDCRFDTRGCESDTPPGPVCTADSDCMACGAGTSSCVKGFCTPYITNFTPNNGAIGTWTTLTGCYFGCEQGKVYFQKDNLTALPTENKNGLLAGYLFTDTNDISGHNYNGVISGNVSTQDGNLSLGGADGDYLTLGALSDPNLYDNGGNKTGTFISKIKWNKNLENRIDTLGTYLGGLHIIGIDGGLNGAVRVYINPQPGWIISKAKIKSGEWTEIAVVWADNDNVKLYINGIFDSEARISAPISFDATWLAQIGLRYPGDPDAYRNFGGQIDHLMIYNRALSGDEVANFYKLTHQQGLRPGDECPANWQCHKSCSDQYCVGGLNNEKPCTSDSNCPDGSCQSNSKECNVDSDCKVCRGGANIGLSCTANIDCPSSICGTAVCRPDWIGDKAQIEAPNINTLSKSCIGKFCVGGENDKKLCTVSDDCPNGSCLLNPRCATDDDCDGNICKFDIDDDAKTGPLNLVTSFNSQDDTQHLLTLNPTQQSDFVISTNTYPQICVSSRQFKVASTNPLDNAGITTDKLVCRNAKINIYFDTIVAANKITKANFLLSICPNPSPVVPKVSANQGFITQAVAFVVDIFQKLFSVQRDASAQASCVAVADYKLEVENSNTTKVSIVPKGILDPETVYTVTVLGGAAGIADLDGALLDPSNSPKKIVVNNMDMEAYIFEFKTMGTSDDAKSGICSVDWIDVSVYRKAPGEGSLASRGEGELRINDLFICAGKNNCNLALDYDQDKDAAGNQHIYKASAQYNGGQELQATFQWSKTDASDPQKAIILSNDYGFCVAGESGNDICKSNSDCGTNGVCDLAAGDLITDDQYKVKNNYGLTFATAGALKEGVTKLAIEAQALASTASALKEFTVYILLCENPWPGVDEKFPISSIINAYNFQTYYCRDASTPGGPLLPAARWLAPKEGKLNLLQNTDFEFGNLTYWDDLTGNAFNSQPVFRDLPKERGGASANIQGAWWLNTSERYRGQSWENINVVQGTTSIGILQSSAFVLEGAKLDFLIGGTASTTAWTLGLPVVNFNDTTDPYREDIQGVTAAVLFIRDGLSSPFYSIRSESGSNSQDMTRKSWTIDSVDIGKTGIIYIYDNSTAGYISFDDLRQFKLEDGNDFQIPIQF